MKNTVLIACVCLGLSNWVLGQEVKALSYNIKYDNTSDTINNWNDRKEAMVQLIKFYGPEIFGTQEALHHQTQYLDNALADYSYVGVGRDDGKEKGEYTAIHYHKKKFNLQGSGTFWLSQNPERVSVGWDASMERICTYALFLDRRSKKQFYVFNTHFDHRGKEARKQSVHLILRKIKEINKGRVPLILMGDLNLRPEESPIQVLQNHLDDGLEYSATPFYGPMGTFNGFDQQRELEDRIDYIFVRDFKVMGYQHIDDRMPNNKHISDHLPVLITLDP